MMPRIMITGSIYDNVDLINKYVKMFSVDCVVVSGNFGLHYLHDKNYYKDIRYKGKTNFPDYLAGRKRFLVPVYMMGGKFDNKQLCKKLLQRQGEYRGIVDNLRVLSSGEYMEFDEIPFFCIGGYYMARNFNNNPDKENIKYMYANKLHLVVQVGVSLFYYGLDFIVMHDIAGKVMKRKRKYRDEMKEVINCEDIRKIFVGGHDFYSDEGKIVFLPPIDKGFCLYEDGQFYYIDRM